MLKILVIENYFKISVQTNIKSSILEFINHDLIYKSWLDLKKKINNKFIAFLIKPDHDLIYKSKLLKYLYLNFLYSCALL